MSTAQLSPGVLIANPSHLNPLAHASHNTTAAAAGSVAQQTVSKAKSDSVNISKAALAKAEQAARQESNPHETETKNAAPKSKAA